MGHVAAVMLLVAGAAVKELTGPGWLRPSCCGKLLQETQEGCFCCCGQSRMGQRDPSLATLEPVVFGARKERTTVGMRIGSWIPLNVVGGHQE